MPKHLVQAVLDVAVAPARVGYLIREGSRDGFRRAVQEACTRWGGQTEPIVSVPVGGLVDGWWRQVVQLAGDEALVNVDESEDDALTVAGTLGLPLVPLVHIDQWRTASSFTGHPSCIDSTRSRPRPTLVV